jgi:hypothetical protein
VYNIGISYNSSNNTYTLTGPSGFNEYRWVKDEGDVENSSQYTSGITRTITAGTSDRDVYTCFIRKTGEKGWGITNPFVVPNLKDQEFSLFTPSGTTVSGNSSNGSFRVDAAGVTWNSSIIYNQGSGWLSTSGSTSGGSGYFDLSFSTTSNTSGSPRTAQIRVVGQNALGNTITRNFLVTQSSGSISTSLTTLTPTNGSGEWSPWGGSQFNGKNYSSNTMQVSGVQYSQGIGTHANSRIVYNLSGGSYTTFTGLVGRDDQADNEWDSGKVVFSIKTDGSTVWTSSVHGNTTNAQSFSVNVAGKSTLELLVSESSDGVSYDHANWMNVYLSGSGGSSCTNAAPTAVAASPSSFSSGGGTTNLSANCPSGTTVQWSGSVGTGSPKSVSVTTTTTYTAKCVSAGCGDSPTVPVTVTVSSSPPATGCSALSNNLVMGTWTVTGHQLVAKQFHGQWWLVQRINTSPETFLVRGSNMLTRSDVSLTSGAYSGLTDCFAWKNSNFGGLQVPSSSEFATPSGYTLAYESDGTPYYTASGTPPSGCTNAYLTNSWTYASAGYYPVPKIGQSVSGGNMVLGSTNYTSSYPGTGIGTHATSEIIYDLGASHTYQYFKATAGKDEGYMCGDNRLIFKVINNATSAVLMTSPTIGNPAYGFPNQTEMNVPITGVRYLKLVVEDGGDGLGCDHANWARARLACTSSGRVSARDSLDPLFTIYPNVNNGEFTVEVALEVDGDYTVDLVNSSGAIYKQEKHKGRKGQNPIQFKSGNVQSGLYLLRVTTKDRLETKTVVIEK